MPDVVVDPIGLRCESCERHQAGFVVHIDFEPFTVCEGCLPPGYQPADIGGLGQAQAA